MKTTLALSFDTDGPPSAHMTANTVLGVSGIKENRSAKDKLDKHNSRKNDKEWDSYGKR